MFFGIPFMSSLIIQDTMNWSAVLEIMQRSGYHKNVVKHLGLIFRVLFVPSIVIII